MTFGCYLWFVPQTFQPPEQYGRRLLIVDDDLLCREVLGLLAAEAGFQVETVESGEAALEFVGNCGALVPHAVLVDMQMPGVSGDSLARLLRAACGPAIALIAMSGSSVPAELTSSFNCFLLKPFSIEDLCAALEHRTVEKKEAADEEDQGAILSSTIYASFAKALSPVEMRQLYKMCLDDAEGRIEHLRKATASGDGDGYRRAAHAIKGGCGMVGALELARLASRMEEHGPDGIDNINPLEQFLTASAHLRRILESQLK